MKRILVGTYIAIIIGMWLIVMMMTWIIYEASREKAPIQHAEELLDDKVELCFQGDDIQVLFKEVEELLHYRKEGWNLGRVTVRQMKNGKETMDYKNVYLYYKPEEETDAIYRRIRILNENARWYVVEAIQQDETYEHVHMDENMSEPILEEIWRLAEEQVFFCFSEGDEYEITVTSKEVNITFFQENGVKDKSITKRLAFLIHGTEGGYQLEAVSVYSD